MGDVVILSFANGTVGRMQFVASNVPDEAIQAAIAKGGFPAGVPVMWRRVALEDFPADPTFRNAWTDTGRIEVDMPKAREIHKDNLRAMRSPKLAALDADYLRADETGDTVAKTRIAAEKQALRNVTADPAIEAAKTPEELKAVLPPALRTAGQVAR